MCITSSESSCKAQLQLEYNKLFKSNHSHFVVLLKEQVSLLSTFQTQEAYK